MRTTKKSKNGASPSAPKRSRRSRSKRHKPNRNNSLEAMRRIDWEKERTRLTHLYAGMEDGELEKIGANPDSLTAVACQVLAAEMLKRGMKLPEPPPPRVDIPSPIEIKRYRDLNQASIAQSILESAGIESFLAD